MKFTKLHKDLASCNYNELINCYKKTEIGLKRACRTGDKKLIDKAMANHQAFEYALLYRQTPEFKTKRRKNGKF